MTSAEIAELREFISGELQKVHTGLEQVNTRVDQVYAGQRDFQEYVAGHFGKALGSTNRRIEKLRSDMDRGFGDLREETSTGFGSWGERVVALEDRVEGMEAKRG